MMSTKNEQGFSLIESMVAIAMIGLVLTPMFSLQTTVFSSVIRVADRIHRMIQAQAFVFTASREQPPHIRDFKLEKKEEKPKSTLRYSFGSVDKKSSLSKLKNIYRQEVVAEGPGKDSPQGNVILFVFKAEQPQQ